MRVGTRVGPFYVPTSVGSTTSLIGVAVVVKVEERKKARNARLAREARQKINAG